MFDVKDRYFSLNRSLLIAIGLWPYTTSRISRVLPPCINIILISSIIVQFTPFLTSKCTADLFLKIFSVASSYICLIIKYNSFYTNSKTIQCLMEQFQSICDNLKENEDDIMQKYGNVSKRITSLLTIFFVGGVSIILSGQLFSFVLHSKSSQNLSQQYHLQQIITTEYFIDQEKYSHLILLHMGTAVWIGIFSTIATGTMLLAYLQHACGMFRIASFRIKHIPIHKNHDSKPSNENLIFEGIICAIDIHRKAMLFSNNLISNFETWFFLLIIFGVLSLSLSIFRIFQVVSSTYNIDELLPFIISASFAVMYMFFANLIGQQIIDHNDGVFITAYTIPWYLTSVRFQRLILFLIQRGNKIFGLNVGGLFIASLQCFATLVNSSVSYFTVIHSAK